MLKVTLYTFSTSLYPSILFYPFHLRSISVAQSLLSVDCCPLSSKTKLRHCQPLLTTVSPRIPYRVYLRGILVWWRTEVLTSRRLGYAGNMESRILATLVLRRIYGFMESRNFCGLMLKVSAAPRQQTTVGAVATCSLVV